MRTKKLIFSLLALANVMFVPIFEVWGGLFPQDVDDNFLDVLEYAIEGDFSYWVVCFTLAIFIPSFFMLVFSFSDSAKAFRCSAAAGILFVLYWLIRFVAQYEIDYLFDFDDGNISIGTWIGFFLFIIAFIAVHDERKQSYVPVQGQTGNMNVTGNSEVSDNVEVNPAPAKNFCSQCGSKITESAEYCEKCGHKI